ncbi:MAG TPA: DNA methyltransferase, partial [Bacteroidales bacterium]|nr:DNA methyltransferase [Bacteroidales bacterium]
MIYIDPPYNTGSDGFVYNDDRKYTVKELQNLIGIDEEKAKRILEFAQSKSNSHSAWLTFMYPRLYIARQLLREDGVIFVSIDDNEVAQLRLLMDEIFGEENFVVQFIRKSVSNRAMAKYSNTQHEYVIAFAKNLTYLELSGDYKDLSAYQNPDNDPNGEWVVSNPSRVGGYVYGIKNPYTGKVEYPPKGRGWVFKEKDLEELINQGKLVFLKEYKENQRGFILKGYLKDLKSERKLINSLDLSVNFYMNQVGTKELIDLMGDNYFSFPKPVSLVKYFANIIQDDNAIILDFFAGSGTTGDAVMQLNAEDGGNRKYILVQLPEPIDPKKNKTAYDFVKDELKAEPTIFEICKERLIRAAKKIKEETIDKKITEKEKELQNLQSELNLEDRDEKIKSLEKEIENLQKQDLGFKIFETMPIWEDYNFEAEEFNPQQELFDTSKLTEDDIKALLVTWKTYDGIALT